MVWSASYQIATPTFSCALWIGAAIENHLVNKTVDALRLHFEGLMIAQKYRAIKAAGNFASASSVRLACVPKT